MYNIFKPFLGEGLVTASGNKWRRNRKVINPAFHVTVLGSFVPVFVSNSAKMAAKMAALAESGEEFCAADFSFPCALDIICETALGSRVAAQDGTCKDFNAALREAVGILMRRTFHPWLLIDWIFNLTPEYRKLEHHHGVLKRLSLKVVNERRAYRKTKNFHMGNDKENPHQNLTDPRKSTLFLDLLLDMQESDNSQMTEDELFNEVKTFLIAGHETTAMLFCFCLLMIALHSDVQERVYEELQSIFMTKPLEDMDLNDLRDMKFLERCILETLRLYPTIPAIARTLTRDLQLGTYTLPAGCQVVVPIVLLQRDADTYVDPHSFKPDRFEQERHPFSYLPFSTGPRGCIGQKFAILELKVMLSTVLWQYWVHPVTTIDDVKLRWKLTLSTEKPLRFRLERRKTAH